MTQSTAVFFHRSPRQESKTGEGTQQIYLSHDRMPYYTTRPRAAPFSAGEFGGGGKHIVVECGTLLSAVVSSNKNPREALTWSAF